LCYAPTCTRSSPLLPVTPFISTHFFFLRLRPLPRSTLFPYTTLFRSRLIALLLFFAHSWVLAQETRETRELVGTLGNRTAFLVRSEEHTSELQSRFDLVCRLLLEKNKRQNISNFLRRTLALQLLASPT